MGRSGTSHRKIVVGLDHALESGVLIAPLFDSATAQHLYKMIHISILGLQNHQSADLN